MKKTFFLLILLAPIYTKAQLGKDTFKIVGQNFRLDITMNGKNILNKPKKLYPLLYSVPNAAKHLKKYRTENKLNYLVNALALSYLILHHPKGYYYPFSNKFTPREKQVFISTGITLSSLILVLTHSTKHLKNAALAYNDAVMKR